MKIYTLLMLTVLIGLLSACCDEDLDCSASYVDQDRQQEYFNVCINADRSLMSCESTAKSLATVKVCKQKNKSLIK